MDSGFCRNDPVGVGRAESCPRGNELTGFRLNSHPSSLKGKVKMNGLIYLVGLVVVILAILSFFGLR
jgi:hypothetical protein